MIETPATGVQRVARAFAACRAEGRAALVGYVAAGDPDMATTAALVHALAGNGADIIELGIPFSDPLADGPIIQAAYTRALAAGASVRAVLALVEQVTARTNTPLVLMSACNPVLAYGVAAFCRDAAAAGASGILLADLLVEDADELRACAAAHGLATVFLVAPVTAEPRVAAAAAAATGFLYLTSRSGVTGPSGVGADIEHALARARRHASVPVAVGFGVSTAADAARIGAIADGVIVGSAFVAAAYDACRAALDPADAACRAAAAVGTLAAELSAAVRAAGTNASMTLVNLKAEHVP